MLWCNKRREVIVVGSAKRTLLFKRYSWSVLVKNSPTTNTNINDNTEIKQENHKFRTFERSSSTASASVKTSTITKPIDEDDEYTKITTPRQDVLFKRRYYNRRAEAAMNKLQNEDIKEMTYENDMNGHAMEGEDPSQSYVCAAPPNAYIDPSAVYFMNGGSYEIYDPYAGNLTVVVAPPSGHYAPGGSATQPLIAAVPCQPVPLQSVQWFNPTPAQGDWCPYPSSDPANCYPIESQNGSGVGSESSGITENPSEVMEESMMNNNATMYQQPSYVYPGYVFGAPIYNVNGVNVQYCRAPSPTPSSNCDLLTGKRKKKRKRRRRTGEEDDESVSSTEDQYNQTVIYETNIEESANHIQTTNSSTEETLQSSGVKEQIDLEKDGEGDKQTEIKEPTSIIKSKSSGLNVNCKPYVCKQDRLENNDKHDLSSETGCSSNNSDSGISSPNSDTSHLKEDLCQSKIHFKGKKEQVNEKNPSENKRQANKGTNNSTTGASSNSSTSAQGHKKPRSKKSKENHLHENHEFREIQEESGLQHALSNLSKSNNSNNNNNKTRPKNKTKGKDKFDTDVDKKKKRKIIQNGIIDDKEEEIGGAKVNTKKLNNQNKKYEKSSKATTDNENKISDQKLKNNKNQNNKETKKSKKGKEQHENEKTNEKLSEIEDSNHLKEVGTLDPIEEKSDYLEEKMEDTYVYVNEKPLLAKLVDIERLPELSNQDENKTEDFTQFSSCREDIQPKSYEEGVQQPKAPPRRKKVSVKSIENVAKDIVEEVVTKAAEEALQRGKDKAHLPITTAVSEWLNKQGGLVVPSDDSAEGSDFSDGEGKLSISHEMKNKKLSDKSCIIS